MSARVAPASPPLPPEIERALTRVMPKGVPPLLLFTTLARDPRLFQRFFAGGLLDRGNLTLRQREIIIDRVTALCGAEYEWGVHVTLFAERAGIDASMIRSLVHGDADDPCWSADDRLLIRACDRLHVDADIDDGLWAELSRSLGEMALIELLMLAGFYRTVSYLANALRLPLESFAARFAEHPAR